MIDKFLTELATDRFNAMIDAAKEAKSFEEAISLLNENSRKCIIALENVVRQMKQEEHDLMQDIHNKFKNKGYVKKIKF